MKQIGFKYQKYNKRQILMEASLIRIWHCDYLKKIQEYQKNGHLIVYIDKTWFNSHKTLKMHGQMGLKKLH